MDPNLTWALGAIGVLSSYIVLRERQTSTALKELNEKSVAAMKEITDKHEKTVRLINATWRKALDTLHATRDKS